MWRSSNLEDSVALTFQGFREVTALVEHASLVEKQWTSLRILTTPWLHTKAACADSEFRFQLDTIPTPMNES